MSIMRIILFFLAAVTLAALVESSLSSVNWNDSPIKAAFVVMAAPLLRFFNNASSAFILSGILILSAVVLSIWYWTARVRPISKALAGLIAEIEMKMLGTTDGMQVVDQTLSSSPLVRQEWSLFRNRLTFTQSNPDTMVPSSRLSEYVTVEGLDRHGLLRQQMSLAPEYFLGIGLILTFCSLVSGLYFASRGIISPDLAEARQSLQLLLNALSFKFLTSIVGLASALLLTAVSRQAIVQVGLAVDTLCMAVDSHLSRSGDPDLQPTAKRHRITQAGSSPS